MKTDRNKLLAKLHVLISQRGIDKEALYAGYGVTTARDLTDDQVVDCINRIEGNPGTSQWRSSSDAELRRLRSDILSLLTKSPQARDPKKRGLGIPNDWETLNPWIERHAGVRLNRLTADQLEAFRRQLLALRAKGWFWHAPNTAQNTPSPQPTTPTQQSATPTVIVYLNGTEGVTN